jgi:hypothetical protein
VSYYCSLLFCTPIVSDAIFDNGSVEVRVSYQVRHRAFYWISGLLADRILATVLPQHNFNKIIIFMYLLMGGGGSGVNSVSISFGCLLDDCGFIPGRGF